MAFNLSCFLPFPLSFFLACLLVLILVFTFLKPKLGLVILLLPLLSFPFPLLLSYEKCFYLLVYLLASSYWREVVLRTSIVCYLAGWMEGMEEEKERVDLVA